jgi:hypothetical protein
VVWTVCGMMPVAWGKLEGWGVGDALVWSVGTVMFLGQAGALRFGEVFWFACVVVDTESTSASCDGASASGSSGGGECSGRGLCWL